MNGSIRDKYVWIWIGIVILATAARLYKFNSPIADWHSWRQSDTAAVARNYVRFGIDPLLPRYDDLSNIQSGKDNPMGYRMVEFPLYQIVAAGAKRLLGTGSIEFWLRSISIFASVSAVLFTGFILSMIASPGAGVATALIYALLPFSVYYGRAILPDGIATALAVVSVWIAVRNDHMAKKDDASAIPVVLSAIFAALALLVKPTAGFLLIPSGVLVLMRNRRRFVYTLIFCAISLGPLWLWRQWIMRFPEGIPVYLWLLNEGNIRLKGAWFHWLFAKRLAELMLGYWGVVLLSFGIISSKMSRQYIVLWSWLAGQLAYWVIFAKGNVQHDYYQIISLPPVAAFVGLGFMWLWSKQTAMSVARNRLFLLVVCAFMFAFSWYTIRSYYWINRPEIIEAGREADALLPDDAKVIAPYNGDTTFLYQTGRQGWPLGFDIDEKILQGATHYVTVSPSDDDLETRDLAREYTVLVRNDRYAIIDLTQRKSN